MIIVKDKTEKVEISMIRNSTTYCKQFSIVMQNTISKDIKTFTTQDFGNPLYMKFNLNLSNLEDGEYYVLVFENPDGLPFDVSTNNPKEATFAHIRYIANKDMLIMNGDFYLAISGKSDEKIDYIQTELLRIGEYKTPTTQYKAEQKYKTYKG